MAQANQASQADDLAELYARENEHLRPPEDHHCKFRAYRPPLNAVQEKVYDEAAKYILVHSERATGKTWVALHKLVDHCRNTRNALGLVIVAVKRMAEAGGAWHKLLIDVLPQWEAGCGLAFTQPKSNEAKDIYIWVANRFGGWSQIRLLSMPVDAFIQDRIRGIEPSFIFVDEAQTLDSDSYFKYVVQQLGRRPGSSHQQIVYCCNPAGPSHWLYHRFFELPVTVNEDGTTTWDSKYAVWHIPIADNIINLEDGYYENVREAVRDDETEYRRMVLGEWVDAPEGDALFKDDFSERLHMRGDLVAGQGLIPIKGFPIIYGWDAGSAHSSIHFQQFIPTKEKLLWIIFDEINHVDRYTPYPILVPQVVKRMDYWNERVGEAFQGEHISDNSAFNQWRATQGSYDYQDIEALSKGRIRLLECPKGPGSVETRVRQTKEKLHDVTMMISATCPRTKEMFLKLERDRDGAMTPKKKSRFCHSFDSMTYPHLFYGSTRRNMPHRTQVGPVDNLVYAMGSGQQAR